MAVAAASGAARTFGEGLRRSTVAHFASKVSYNAGAATDDCAGQRKSQLRRNRHVIWQKKSRRHLTFEFFCSIYS